MSRYEPRYADGEYVHKAPCDVEGCRGEVKFHLVVEVGRLPHDISGTCSECGKHFVRYRKPKAPDLRWHQVVMMALLVAIVGPIIFADGYLWRALNSISMWLQKALGLSKYHLSLTAFVAGIAAMVLAQVVSGNLGPFSVLVPVVWGWWAVPYMRWCWAKIKSGAAGDEGDTRSLVDHKVIESTTFTRSFYMIFAIVVSPLYLSTEDPFPVAVMLLSVGYYWLDSDFVPPSRRWVLEMGRRWVSGET
jgi:hypothetical protein